MRWIRSIVSDNLLTQADFDQQSIEQAMQDLSLADGSSVRVFDVGDGDPILFIPTVPELSFVYAPQLEAFRLSHRVILYEPRVRRRRPFGIVERTREVVLLTEALGFDNAHIVAWSDAGSTAYSMAKNWPEKCGSLVLIGLADSYRFPQPLDFLARFLLKAPVERLVPKLIIASMLGMYFAGKGIKFSWIVNRALQVPRLSQLFKYSILPCMLDHRPQSDEVAAPSLVICGDSDPLVSVEQAKQMADLLSSVWEMIVIPGGEHLLIYTDSADIIAAMNDFYFTVSPPHPTGFQS